MTAERPDEVIAYRLKRAWDTLEDARILADADRWNSCVNRLYYACFYAISALLLKNGYTASKHSGIRGLFNRHFVKTGIVSRDMARIYNDLFERRQESDYVDFAYFTEEHARPWIDQAASLIDRLAELIEGAQRGDSG